MDRREFFKSYIAVFCISNFPGFVFSIERNKENNQCNWFIKNRIQAHIRLSLNYIKTKDNLFFIGNRLLKRLGTNVIVRHFKSADEGAWWFSNYGDVAPVVREINKNIAKEIIKDAHSLGMKIIAYYRHMEDKYIEKKHPEWLCRDWNGNPIKTLTKRGYHICFNSPYRDFVKNRLKELALMGIDGFYFDESHMPRYGCWCSYCQTLFKKIYKKNPPTNYNPYDRVWAVDYVKFNNKTVENTFNYWKKEIKNVKKECVFIISLNVYPTFLDHHLSTKLMKIADSVKTEFKTPVLKKAPEQKNFLFNIPLDVKFRNNIRLALGYTFVRDGSNKYPSHIWIPEALDEITGMYAISGVLTYGNIANINILEDYLHYKNGFYKKFFHLKDKLNNLFCNLKPFDTIGIYYSENSRNIFVPEYKKSFFKVIHPIYKAYEICFNKKLPSIIYTDETINNLQKSNTKILFIPTFLGISKKSLIEIKKFKANGGIITTNINRFSYLLDNKIKFPIKIKSSYSNDFHIGYYKKNSKILVFICNEFDWVAKLQWDKIIKKKLPLKYKVPKNLSIDVILNNNFSSSVKNIKTLIENSKNIKRYNDNKLKIEPIKMFEILEISLKK